MGEVYLAEHPRLPRLDALKVLPTAVSVDPEFRARFNREADLAANLWHPHIVGVHDRGEFNGQLWISMDYVDGIDAARLVQHRPGAVPIADVLAITDAIAEALDFAHDRRLLHRDVKPANILLSQPARDRQRILLADFGIARAADDISGLTSTNYAVGTVSYAAPEQLLGDTLDGRADQYALAATAYHLCAGEPPFVHSNPAVVISRHLGAPPPPLSHLRPELEPLDAVLARGLSKDRAERYPTCADFALALRNASGVDVGDRRERGNRRLPEAPDAPNPVEATIAASDFAALAIDSRGVELAEARRLRRWARLWKDQPRAVKASVAMVFGLLAVALLAYVITDLYTPMSSVSDDPRISLRPEGAAPQPNGGSTRIGASCVDSDKIVPDQQWGRLWCLPSTLTWGMVPPAEGVNVTGSPCTPGVAKSISTDSYLIACDQIARQWTRYPQGSTAGPYPGQ